MAECSWIAPPVSPQPFRVCGPLRLPVLPDASEWRRSGVVAEFPRWAVVGFTAPLSWMDWRWPPGLFERQNQTAQVLSRLAVPLERPETSMSCAPSIPAMRQAWANPAAQGEAGEAIGRGRGRASPSTSISRRTTLVERMRARILAVQFQEIECEQDDLAKALRL